MSLYAQAVAWETFRREVALWKHNADGRNPSLPKDIGLRVAVTKKEKIMALVTTYPVFPETLKRLDPAAYRDYERMMR